MLRTVAAALLAPLVLLAAGCTTGTETETETVAESRPASPQVVALDWNEVFSAEGGEMRFRVYRFAVLEDGWEAEIGFSNDTDAAFSVGEPGSPLSRQFGLMLFPTGDLRELERRNSAGDLPRIRRAHLFAPALPPVLKQGGTWRGTIRGRGSLAAGRFVRLVFGTFVPEGEPPKGYPDQLLWITDHAYELAP